MNDLLTKIRAFLDQRDISPTVFGREALNDPGFVFDLERGRSPSLKTAERVEKFMVAKGRFLDAKGRK